MRFMLLMIPGGYEAAAPGTMPPVEAVSLFYDFRNESDMPSVYVAFVGTGENPSILGIQFYVFYTSYPGNGLGWSGASVKRFTVSCK